MSILVEKPLSTHQNASNNSAAAKGLLKDYDELEQLYVKARLKDPRTVVTVMAQRRYHNSFVRIRELISEVFEKTGCPVTAVQVYHADGQWRMPDELIDIDYHGFNRGFGIVSHSGYHVFDIVPFIIEAAQKTQFAVDSVEAFSTFTRPADLLGQLRYEDYARLFPEFSNRHSEAEYSRRTHKFGEVDAFISLTFKHKSQIITQATLNLFHNSFSKRAWLSSEGRDLAHSNGRIGHETYIINQGPFQTIYLHSFKGEGKANDKNPFGIGGQYHIEMHAFRNSNLFGDWKAHQSWGATDLSLSFPEGDFSWSAYEGARRKCLKEFISYLQGTVSRNQLRSELYSHRHSVLLASAAYQSAVLRLHTDRNPLVTLPYNG